MQVEARTTRGASGHNITSILGCRAWDPSSTEREVISKSSRKTLCCLIDKRGLLSRPRIQSTAPQEGELLAERKQMVQKMHLDKIMQKEEEVELEKRCKNFQSPSQPPEEGAKEPEDRNGQQLVMLRIKVRLLCSTSCLLMLRL